MQSLYSNSSDGANLNRAEMRQCVLKDRLSFLLSLQNHDLSQGTLMDLQHQSILRILSERASEDDKNYFITQYCYHPEKRSAFLHNAVKVIKSELVEYSSEDNVEILDRQAPTEGGFIYSSHDREVGNLFFESAQGVQSETDVLFNNDAGFACFFNTERKNLLNKVDSIICPSTEYASIGALMYYGFTHEKQACFLLSSIDILSRVLFSKLENIEHWIKPVEGAKEMMGHELAIYIDCYDGQYDYNTLYNDVFEMLVLHEYGHFANDPEKHFWVFDALDYADVDKSSLYQVRFPPKEMLGGWQRIKDGKGSVEDVLFLLGDYIANMNVLDCMSKPQTSLVKLFHWWLVRPPGINSRPRGFSPFIVHAIKPELDMATEELGEILKVAKDTPELLAKKLLAFEEGYWKNLQKHICD